MTTKRYALADIAKYVCSIFVVAMHVDWLSSVSTATYLFVNGPLRIAVPFFFIINGFFLFRKSDAGLAEWLIRCLKLYLFWMVLFLPLYMIKLRWSIDSFITVIFGFHHLWYLSSMILAGLLIYLSKSINRVAMLFLAAILLLTGASLQIAIINFNAFELLSPLSKVNTYRNFIFFAFPLMYVGYCLSKGEIKLSNRTLLAASIFMLMASLAEAYSYLKLQHGALHPIDIVLSSSVLAFLMLVAFINNPININTTNLSKLATAVYLIHPFVMIFAIKVVGKNQPLIILLITVLGATSIGFIITKLNKRLKFIL